ncbi:MAG: hypothetical protein M1269_13890 [Chloroflexi bacterium]|nr:hypothetical protein [Chloroflexota bacterium]
MKRVVDFSFVIRGQNYRFKSFGEFPVLGRYYKILKEKIPAVFPGLLDVETEEGLSEEGEEDEKKIVKESLPWDDYKRKLLEDAIKQGKEKHFSRKEKLQYLADLDANRLTERNHAIERDIDMDMELESGLTYISSDEEAQRVQRARRMGGLSVFDFPDHCLRTLAYESLDPDEVDNSLLTPKREKRQDWTYLRHYECDEFFNLMGIWPENENEYPTLTREDDVVYGANPKLLRSHPAAREFSHKKLFVKMLTYKDDRMIVCDYVPEPKTLDDLNDKKSGFWYNPVDDKHGLFIEFKDLDISSDEKIKEFLEQYGALGFMELGYNYIHICEKGLIHDPNTYEKPPENGELWFEPVEWFKEQVSTFKKIIETYNELQKTKNKLDKGFYSGTKGADKEKKDEVKLKNLDHNMTHETIRDINLGLQGASVVLAVDPETFTQGWLFFCLYHALYIQLYENVLSGKLRICPSCGNPFIKKGKQKYCKPNCGNKFRVNKFRDKKRGKKLEVKKASSKKKPVKMKAV